MINTFYIAQEVISPVTELSMKIKSLYGFT